MVCSYLLEHPNLVMMRSILKHMETEETQKLFKQTYVWVLLTLPEPTDTICSLRAFMIFL